MTAATTLAAAPGTGERRPATDPAAALWPDDLADSTAIKARNAIEREGILTIAHLTALTAYELLDLRHFGPAMLQEVRRALGAAGHALAGETPDGTQGGWALPRGVIPPGPRASVVHVRLCASCAGFAPAASPGYPGTLSGQCQGCGARGRELHSFPAAVNSAAGCACTTGCGHVTGGHRPRRLTARGEPATPAALHTID